jgi:alkyldihydroxyacetonephosphate synthase
MLSVRVRRLALDVGAFQPCAGCLAREVNESGGTVSPRFSHVYPDGPAVYYTFSIRGDPGRLIEQWRHIKTRASDALIAAGTITTTIRRSVATICPGAAQRLGLSGKALRRRKAHSTRLGS